MNNQMREKLIILKITLNESEQGKNHKSKSQYNYKDIWTSGDDKVAVTFVLYP